jgi:hypothetical protein
MIWGSHSGGYENDYLLGYNTAYFHASILLGLFDSEDGCDVPPKRRSTFNGLHGVTPQKTVLFLDYINFLLYFFKHATGKIFRISCIKIILFYIIQTRLNNILHIINEPITVAARCKAWTVLARWNRGFESQLRYGCLCVRLFCVCVVLCVGSGLATGSSPVQGVLPSM